EETREQRPKPRGRAIPEPRKPLLERRHRPEHGSSWWSPCEILSEKGAQADARAQAAFRQYLYLKCDTVKRRPSPGSPLAEQARVARERGLVGHVEAQRGDGDAAIGDGPQVGAVARREGPP